MLTTCVNLIAFRLGAMDGEARKHFILILAQLIEKSPVCLTFEMFLRVFLTFICSNLLVEVLWKNCRTHTFV